MTKRAKFLVLIFLLVFFAKPAFAMSTDPPEPTAYADGPTTVPCSEQTDTTTTGGVSPPPGLCLPINDYLVPLFFAGLCLGSFFLMRCEAKGNL